MSSDSRPSDGVVMGDYAALLNDFIGNPSEAALEGALSIGAALLEQGVPPDQVAARHCSSLYRLCAGEDTRRCCLLDKSQPMLSALMRPYGDVFREQREPDHYLRPGVGRAGHGRDASAAHDRLDVSQHVQQLLAASPAILYSCGPGPDYPTLFISENIRSQFGYEPEEFYADPLFWTLQVHPEDIDRVMRELVKIEEQESVSYEYRFRQKNGHYVWLHDQVVQLKDSEGRLIGIVGSWFDISGRRDAEDAERETLGQLNATLDALPDLMFEMDIEGRIYGYRAPHPVLLYAPPEEFLGRMMAEVLPVPATGVLMRALRDADESGRHRGATYSLEMHGETAWFELSIAAHGVRGEPNRRFVMLVRDITERKHAEQALREASDELEKRVDERTIKLAEANAALKGEIMERKQIEAALRKSERRYRAIVEDQTEMICRWATGYKHTFVNDAYCRTLGHKAEELLGESFMPFIPVEDQPAALEHFAALTPDDPVATIEHGVIAPDGEVRWHQWTNRAIYDEHDQLIEYQSVGRDITEKKHAEDALRASEERYRSLVESQTSLIVRLDSDGRFSFVNEAFCRMFGESRDDLLGSGYQRLVHPEDLPTLVEAIERLKVPPFRAQVEFRGITSSGWRWLLWEGRGIRDGTGELGEIQGVGWDVTERRLAERTARHRAEILEAVSIAAKRFLEEGDWRESVDDVLSHLGTAVEASRAYILENHVSDNGVLLTSQRHEWVAKGVGGQLDNPDLQNFDWNARGFQRWREILSRGEVVCGLIRDFPETERVFLEGEGVRSIVIVPVFVEKRWWGLMGFSDCVSDRVWAKPEIDALLAAAGTLGASIHRQQTQNALRESEEKYRGIFDESVAAIYVFDAGQRCVDANQAGLDLLGFTREEALAMRMSDVDVDPELVKPAQAQLLAGERVVNHEHRLRRKDGTVVTVLNNSRPLTDADGRVVRIQSTVFDITERTRTAVELQRHREESANMTRLATMGEMATGLAHEVNQPLSAILYYARGCQRRISDDRCDKSEMMRVTEKIAVQAERAGAIVDRIRRFVRKGGPRVSPADLNAVVTQAVEFIDYEIRDADVRLILELGDDLPAVSADTIQIEQVVMNLVRNGIDAMKDSNPAERELTIRTAIVSGGLATCSISDTGGGLDPAVAESMFDAFFTTKPDGTGMGLAISRSIIESHMGRLSGRSNAGRGATFEFTIPVYREGPDDGG